MVMNYLTMTSSINVWEVLVVEATLYIPHSVYIQITVFKYIPTVVRAFSQ